MDAVGEIPTKKRKRAAMSAEEQVAALAKIERKVEEAQRLKETKRLEKKARKQQKKVDVVAKASAVTETTPVHLTYKQAKSACVTEGLMHRSTAAAMEGLPKLRASAFEEDLYAVVFAAADVLEQGGEGVAAPLIGELVAMKEEWKREHERRRKELVGWMVWAGVVPLGGAE